MRKLKIILTGLIAITLVTLSHKYDEMHQKSQSEKTVFKPVVQKKEDPMEKLKHEAIKEKELEEERKKIAKKESLLTPEATSSATRYFKLMTLINKENESEERITAESYKVKIKNKNFRIMILIDNDNSKLQISAEVENSTERQKLFRIEGNKNTGFKTATGRLFRKPLITEKKEIRQISKKIKSMIDQAIKQEEKKYKESKKTKEQQIKELLGE